MKRDIPFKGKKRKFYPNIILQKISNFFLKENS